MVEYYLLIDWSASPYYINIMYRNNTHTAMLSWKGFPKKMEWCHSNDWNANTLSLYQHHESDQYAYSHMILLRFTNDDGIVPAN